MCCIVSLWFIRSNRSCCYKREDQRAYSISKANPVLISFALVPLSWNGLKSSRGGVYCSVTWSSSSVSKGSRVWDRVSPLRDWISLLPWNDWNTCTVKATSILKTIPPSTRKVCVCGGGGGDQLNANCFATVAVLYGPYPLLHPPKMLDPLLL